MGLGMQQRRLCQDGQLQLRMQVRPKLDRDSLSKRLLRLLLHRSQEGMLQAQPVLQLCSSREASPGLANEQLQHRPFMLRCKRSAWGLPTST